MQQVDKKLLTLRKASEELGISERQIKRVRKRYLADGPNGLISKHKGKVSPNRIDQKLRADVVKILKKEEYEGFGPTFAEEKLRQTHGYLLSEETIRKWMIQEKLWKAKKQKSLKIYERRIRRQRFGELLQGDGSNHAWFEARGPRCTLVIFVDDATSQITAGKFVPAETTEAYQEILEAHLKEYGRPLALYVDKHSIFRTTRENVAVKEKETHFGRVLRELGIKLICAHSPQAKGRVERANGTLQDRLVKEMRLKKIRNIEEANEFFADFLKEYNKKFGKIPKDLKDAHRTMRAEDDLEKIFARQSKRKLSKDLSFCYRGNSYQVHTKTPNQFRQTEVIVLERPGKPILVECRGEYLGYSRWKEEYHRGPEIVDSKQLEMHWLTRTKKPGRNHPWR